VKKIELRKLARNDPKADRDAFTLTELMVVIATIGILAAVVLPALAGTKTDSKSFQCMNNLKQLATAWILYSDESNDRLVNLSTYDSDNYEIAAGDRQGVPWRTQLSDTEQPLPTGMAPYTEQAQKYLIEMGFKQPTPTIAGPLYRFAPNADIVHCPADWRDKLYIDVQPDGGPFAWDSYSGSGFLNGEWGSSTPPVNDILKRTGITRPAGKFVWTEASDMRGENLGSWWMGNYGSSTDPKGPFTRAQFSDSPAAFHITSSIFNFCDGHVEIHRWQNPATIALGNDTDQNKDSSSTPVLTAANRPGNVDLIWVGSHYAGQQNP